MPKLSEQTLFLRAYKELEAVCREKGITVYDMETELSEADNRKMQICRLVRNYLVHETGKFVSPTSQMTAFLEKQVKKNTVKKPKKVAVKKTGATVKTTSVKKTR